MRLYILVALALLVSGCGPAEPTGFAISSATNDGDVLITYSVLSDASPAPVRVFVHGDVVSRELFIDDRRYVLSGSPARDGFLLDGGSAVVRLQPGTYRVVAVSCEERVFSVSCERIGRSIRV